MRYFERGKDDGDYIRDFSLALQPGDVECIVDDAQEQTSDVESGMTPEEIRDAIERRKRKQQH